MTSREKFEAWMTDEQWFHGSDFEWDERRNCYAQFGIHLAYKAFLTAEGASEQKLTDMAVQLANAESKCRELAAENAALKADHVRIFNSGYQRGHEATVEGYFVDIHQNDITTYHEDIVAEIEEETPATDAFLAEVLAQGVEMFVSHMDHPHSPYEFTHGYMDKHAIEFAAQLRQEAAQ